jgi:hypothetical protein
MLRFQLHELPNYIANIIVFGVLSSLGLGGECAAPGDDVMKQQRSALYRIKTEQALLDCESAKTGACD